METNATGPVGTATMNAPIAHRIGALAAPVVSALAGSRIVSLSIALIIIVLLLILGIPGSFAS